MFHMCLFVCFIYCFCCVFVFCVVVCALVGPAGLADKCFIIVCVLYVVFVFCVMVVGSAGLVGKCFIGWAGWDGGQECVSYAAFGVYVCVSCGVVCWLGRLGWWTSEKKLLAGRSIRPAMMDRGETR